MSFFFFLLLIALNFGRRPAIIQPRTIFPMGEVVFFVKTRNHATCNSIQTPYFSSSSFVASLSYHTSHTSIRIALFFCLRLLPYKTPQAIAWPSEKTPESIQTVSYYGNMVLRVISISFISEAHLPPSWISPPERPWGWGWICLTCTRHHSRFHTWCSSDCPYW